MKKILIALEDKDDLSIDYRYRENLGSSDSLYTSEMDKELRTLLSFDADKLRKLFVKFENTIPEIHKDSGDGITLSRPKNIKKVEVGERADDNGNLVSNDFDRLMCRLLTEKDCELAFVFIERENRFIIADVRKSSTDEDELERYRNNKKDMYSPTRDDEDFEFFFDGDEFELNTFDMRHYANHYLHRFSNDSFGNDLTLGEFLLIFRVRKNYLEAIKGITDKETLSRLDDIRKKQENDLRTYHGWKPSGKKIKTYHGNKALADIKANVEVYMNKKGDSRKNLVELEQTLKFICEAKKAIDEHYMLA